MLTFLKRSSSPKPPGDVVSRALLFAPIVAGAVFLLAAKRARRSPGVSLDKAQKFAVGLPGRTRRHVHRLLGDPVTTVGRDHWYYPVNGREKIALAITFAADRVSGATVLHAPIPTRSAARSALRY